MSDRQLMRAVRAACEELVAELEGLGWSFDNDPPLHPPGVVDAEHLEALELVVGPLPELVVDFWLEVGGIDLSGEHPDWDEDDLRPFVFEAPVGDLLERAASAAADGAVDRLDVSPDFFVTLPGGDVRTGDGRTLGLVDHLRVELLEHAGIRGFEAGRPDQLAGVVDELPRF